MIASKIVLWLRKKQYRLKNVLISTDKAQYHLTRSHVLTFNLLYVLYWTSAVKLSKKTLITTRQKTCHLAWTYKCRNWPHNDDVTTNQCVTSIYMPSILMRQHAVIVLRTSNIFCIIGHCFVGQWRISHTLEHTHTHTQLLTTVHSM